MTVVSSSLMSRSAFAARARVYAAEATSRARSGGSASRRATMRRTVAVSPMAAAASNAWSCSSPTCCCSGAGPKIRLNMAGVYCVAMTVLVRAVRLIDGVAATPRDGVDVLIDGATIAAVEPHDPGRVMADDFVVVDGAGRTLLPGLIDAHAHYTFDPTEGSLQVIAQRTDEVILGAARVNAERALRAGITTARGAGSIRNLECVLRDEIA